MGRFLYTHRGNGLIVDNIMKPHKGAISTAAKEAGRAVAKALVKKHLKQQKLRQQKQHIVIKSAGKIIYDADNLHLVTFAKNLLEYSDDYARTVAKNSLWYLYTDATSDNTNTGLEARRLLTANRQLVNISIPLNRYSFFEELEGRMLPPMQLDFEIELTPDAEVFFGAADTFRLVIDRFYLWVPRLEPKDALMSKFISDYQKPRKWK